MIHVEKYRANQIVADHYPLIEVLGTTSHSSVFRTECSQAPTGHAAIKLIPAPVAGSEAQLARWRLAARFSHPSLLRVFDMGRCELEGRPMLYVVMELAEENLAEVLPVRSLSPDETSGMLAPVLEALAYLHKKGFVHGNLRPSNILAINDRVKLSTDSIVRIGESVGAREAIDSHRAPESILSAASDVWSLGITIVECLGSRAPKRDSAEGNAVRIPKSVPAPFFDFALRCLNTIPQRRWTVRQLQAMLGFETAESVLPMETMPDPAPAIEPRVPAAAKRDVIATIRRLLTLKKEYRLILAGLVAAAAAFILGVVISGSTFAPLATSGSIARTAKSTLAPVSQHALLTPAKQPNAGPAALKHDGESSRLSTGGENSRTSQRARSEAASVILSNVVPVRPAQLSSPALGSVVPGAITRRAIPRVPPSASDSIWGTVRVGVIVDVDPRGHVVEAKLGSTGPSQYFDHLSMIAAQDWKFAPPRVNGSIVPSEWLIDFGYSKSDTSATATEQHP